MRRALWIVALVVLVVQSGPAVLAAPSLQGGQAVITSPHGPVVVRGNVLISGTAANSEFDYYKVEFAPGSNPRDDQWAIIGSTHAAPVVDGLLETWYTEGRVPDGTYSLRLRVVRRDGNYDEAIVRQITVANAAPTETPTPAATPVPTVTATPLPATPTIVITVPVQVTPLPQPTQVKPAATPSSDQNASLSLESVGSSVCWGGGVALGLFLLVGFFGLVRRLFRLIVYR
jgi:hypothetical protein